MAEVVEFPPQNVNTPIVSSADEATIASQYLVEAFKNPIPNASFATINEIHHTSLIKLAELFNVFPKVAEQQSTNRNNGRRCEV